MSNVKCPIKAIEQRYIKARKQTNSQIKSGKGVESKIKEIVNRLKVSKRLKQ